MASRKSVAPVLVRVGPKHQITIPKPVFDALGLEPGDYVEVSVQGGAGAFAPKSVVDKPARKLTEAERKLAAKARAKIEKIKKDVLKSRGLTLPEAKAAAKAGLIDPDQTYFWLEDWQKPVRASERDHRAGRSVTVTSKEELDALFREIEEKAAAKSKTKIAARTSARRRPA
ncbi:MAG: AbrB/MazE/SpoVT family DNA-binding domain-containing protein [Candidatus Methylomirabilis sp.]|nr:AbrB/MazE/SpoVT family DNA-binding domain-containing protein [Deltaproteobacteria bacterium]